MMLLLMVLAAVNCGSKTNPKATLGTPVVVATHEIEIGSIVHADDFRVISWEGALPPGAVRNEKQVLDRGVVIAINPGEPILESRLAPASHSCGYASSNFPDGKKVMAIGLKSLSSDLPPWLQPAVPGSILISKKATGGESRILVGRAQVVSVGISLPKDSRHWEDIVQLFLGLADSKALTAALDPAFQTRWSVWLVAAEDARENWDPQLEKDTCKFLLPPIGFGRTITLRGSINFDALPASSPIETVKRWAVQLGWILGTREAIPNLVPID